MLSCTTAIIFVLEQNLSPTNYSNVTYSVAMLIITTVIKVCHYHCMQLVVMMLYSLQRHNMACLKKYQLLRKKIIIGNFITVCGYDNSNIQYIGYDNLNTHSPFSIIRYNIYFTHNKKTPIQFTGNIQHLESYKLVVLYILSCPKL